MRCEQSKSALERTNYCRSFLCLRQCFSIVHFLPEMPSHHGPRCSGAPTQDLLRKRSASHECRLPKSDVFPALRTFLFPIACSKRALFLMAIGNLNFNNGSLLATGPYSSFLATTGRISDEDAVAPCSLILGRSLRASEGRLWCCRAPMPSNNRLVRGNSWPDRQIGG